MPESDWGQIAAKVATRTTTEHGNLSPATRRREHQEIFFAPEQGTSMTHTLAPRRGGCLRKCLAVCVVILLAFIGLLILSTHETRVIPRVEGVVVDQQGNPLQVFKSDFTITNNSVEDIEWGVDVQGQFYVPETFRMLHSFPGDPCYNTFIEVHPKGFRPSVAQIGICTGEVVPEVPVGTVFVEFKLARDSSRAASEAIVTDGMTLEEWIQKKANSKVLP